MTRLIDADALKIAIRDGVRNKKNESLFDTIDNMPSVIPTRKKAHFNYKGGEICLCSNCTRNYDRIVMDRWKYCPYCGAEMERD